jgi:hypothetical protein
VRVQFADALEQVGYLLPFELQLGLVTQVLVLATAALAEIRAERLDSFGRLLNNPQQPRTRKSFLYLSQFGFYQFTGRSKGQEDDKIVQSRHAFATESDVANSQTNLFRYSGTHFTSLEAPEFGRKKILGAARAVVRRARGQESGKINVKSSGRLSITFYALRFVGPGCGKQWLW